MPQILVVEDEDIIRSALKRLLERHQFEVQEAASVDEALSRFKLKDFDLIISDLRLPKTPGTDLIKLAEGIPVLIMTSYASLRSAVDSMKMGAVDYIAKPFDHEEMLNAVNRILANHANQRLQEADAASIVEEENSEPGTMGMIGHCPTMQVVYQRIRKVAPTDATVLIQGESGTGKELIAKAIHNNSRRRNAPLISVNCAAIPETLIESELFGYEKGAFTGANTNRCGLVEAADGGTLFLDEIGELPLEAQARLLRVLQEGEIRRIGSVHSKKVDVRLVAATHRNLKKLSSEGDFRLDLYYRLNVMELTLPPLKQRGDDILEIAEFLLSNACKRMERPNLRLSKHAADAISQYDWPGNVRELENAIERGVILAEGNLIHTDDLGIEPVSTVAHRPSIPQVQSALPSIGAPSRVIPRNDGTKAPEDLSLEDYFQHFVLEHQDQMSETELAQKLGISRKCLWERRQRLGIPRRKSPTRKA
ncbi:DNA-binding transcriptional response regulator, NtrC family, contains REC, AAA-type ATPase, and a Fis-type DNA-binding domains [Oceanospirillum multiglobuliferum]|uniref:Response regulator n=1 Tax=Oceanospirillum multiglobuliferum TaxID=64969 RepID=A0A1T4RF25_9GAMM|nr:sigma-54 dependent transcriptional regulator [Oceanospirillum multiglobuliferum]OPX54926.1 response regulator [Oceanospirillum multiglobuliferum]SKA14585.1 DNA-binding transcriptional response regulator, NtrC family, contains REC, AAA-type ATPase, and a Fis-type DNA-binding domains [Oceanospirillum multiglobuliferum]